jgi:hypothetical protein
MLADRLTKLLPKQKYQTFLDLLDIRDIRHLIREEA